MNQNDSKTLLIAVACLTCHFGEGQQQTIVSNFHQADSLFLAKDFNAAGKIYQTLIRDTSTDAFHLNRLGYTEMLEQKYAASEKHFNMALHAHPAPGVKASVYSRLAMLKALQKQELSASVFLDSAIQSGYISLNELDSSANFNNVRSSNSFMARREKLFNSLYPCFNNQQAREFDFWIGEWNVYVTGTTAYAGHSIVQKISGGCALLENWNSSMSEGKSLNFIDDSTGKWKQVWVGSYPNGKQDFVNGVYHDSAMRFTFTTRDVQGIINQGKFTFFNEGVNQVRQLSETSADNGKTWNVNYDFTYKRISL
jgi:hypothetical protein